MKSNGDDTQHLIAVPRFCQDISMIRCLKQRVNLFIIIITVIIFYVLFLPPTVERYMGFRKHHQYHHKVVVPKELDYGMTMTALTTIKPTYISTSPIQSSTELTQAIQNNTTNIALSSFTSGNVTTRANQTHTTQFNVAAHQNLSASSNITTVKPAIGSNSSLNNTPATFKPQNGTSSSNINKVPITMKPPIGTLSANINKVTQVTVKPPIGTLSANINKVTQVTVKPPNRTITNSTPAAKNVTTYPTLRPETVYTYNFSLLRGVEDKCKENGVHVYVLAIYLIKSAIGNIEKRSAIRDTWGNDETLKQVDIRKVFLIGTDSKDAKVKEALLKESDKYNDILLGTFEDTYFNVTVKVMMGLNWARVHCAQAKLFFLLDDNSYVTTRNMLKFLADPSNYKPPSQFSYLYTDHGAGRMFPLYGGDVLRSPPPMRDKGNRWFVSKEEYPYNTYPDYVLGFGVIMNKAALDAFYRASLVTKYCRFDDTYMGFLSHWAGIVPLTIRQFSSKNIILTNKANVNTIVISHGYTGEHMRRVWKAEHELITD